MSLTAELRDAVRRVGQAARSRTDRVIVGRMVASRGPEPTGRFRAVLYFADEPINLYQVRQWYAPLTELAEILPVLVIATNVTTTRALLRECPLPVFFAPTVGSIERRIAAEPLDVVFYVNQNAKNFSMLRFGSPAHVFLSHGESDKGYMTSNQLKAYDVTFVAGQAARDRIRRRLIGYDVESRTRQIGRPQVDVDYDGPPIPQDGLPLVLYAPTWEGDRPSMSYSSIVSHGVPMVTALVRDGGYRIIYRPHPRTGSHNQRALTAHHAIMSAIEAANRADPSARHLIDTHTEFGWQLRAADVCLTDVSAVALDWLATGKPLLVTQPASEEAIVDATSITHHVPTIAANAAADAPEMVRSALGGSDRHEAARLELARYYFGDTTRGASMRRFVHAATTVADERAAARRQ